MANPGTEANFQGFTCRWQDIPGKKPITFSLVVEFKKADFPAQDLPDLQEAIEPFLGESNPLHLYGIHESDRALLTCFLHLGSRREVHFVDSADGGYALAGKMLKQKRGA